MRELHEQLVTGLAIEVLHHFTHRQIERHRYKQMDMVFEHMPFNYLNVIRLQISRTSSRTRAPTVPLSTARRYLVINSSGQTILLQVTCLRYIDFEFSTSYRPKGKAISQNDATRTAP